MRQKRIGWLILLAGLLIVPAMSGAQGPHEEILALAGNANGDSVLVGLSDGHILWITERPRDSATSNDARDAVCMVEQATVTVCGRYVYAALGCTRWAPQMFVFETSTIFPCAQPTTVYIPLIRK